MKAGDGPRDGRRDAVPPPRSRWSLGNVGWTGVAVLALLPYCWLVASQTVAMDGPAAFLSARPDDLLRVFVVCLFAIVLSPIFVPLLLLGRPLGWGVLAIILGWSGVVWRRHARRARRDRRARAGLCADCEHMLRPDQERCPECGSPRRVMADPPAARSPRRAIRVVVRLLVGSIVASALTSVMHHEYMAIMAARFIARIDAAEAAGESAVPTMRLRWAQVDLGWNDPLLWGWDAEFGIWAGQG